MGSFVHTEDLTLECYSDETYLAFINTRVIPFAALWLIAFPVTYIVINRCLKKNVKKLIECNWTLSNLTIDD